MEQVFVVLAVIVYMLFQGAARAGRRPGTGEDEPRSGSPADEQAEAQERAMEALRRWEARQRAATETPPAEPVSTRAGPPVRAPSPPRPRSSATQPAGRSRREAYEAIADMLGRRAPVPPVPEDETVRSLETLVSAEETPRRRRPPAKGRVVPGERRRTPSPRPERVSSVRRRARGEGEGVPVDAAPRRAAVSRSDADRGERRRGAGGLDRLEALPPLERAVVLAEILGPPPSLPGGRFRP